jgi:hypothetical protein
LLATETSKRPLSVLIKCDAPADSAAIYKALRAMRDGYEPPRQ